MGRRSKVVKKKLEKITESNKNRFMEKVEKDEATGCWKWKGAFGATAGYPQFNFRGRTAYAHRVAWTLWKGEIKSHIYRSRVCTLGRKCVNPEHLEEGGVGKYYAELRRGQSIVVQLIPQVIEALTHGLDCTVQVPLRKEPVRACPDCVKTESLIAKLKEVNLSKPPKRGRPPKGESEKVVVNPPAPDVQPT